MRGEGRRPGKREDGRTGQQEGGQDSRMVGQEDRGWENEGVGGL